MEERDDLGSGTLGVRRELCFRSAGSDAILHSPEDCFVEVIVGFDIGEGALRGGGLRTAGGTPQEGDNLCPCAEIVGSELAVSGSGGDAVFDRPKDTFIIETGLFLLFNKYVAFVAFY